MLVEVAPGVSVDDVIAATEPRSPSAFPRSRSHDRPLRVVIVAPPHAQGRLKGQLAPLTACSSARSRSPVRSSAGAIPADAVDAVLVGQVLQAGAGQNAARQAAIAAESAGTSTPRR